MSINCQICNTRPKCAITVCSNPVYLSVTQDPLPATEAIAPPCNSGMFGWADGESWTVGYVDNSSNIMYRRCDSGVWQSTWAAEPGPSGCAIIGRPW